MRIPNGEGTMTDLNLSMFRAYDIRTHADDLSLENAERLARAEARYFREQLGARKIVLARDARLSGPRYLEVGVRVFEECGFEVLVNPRVSSTCLFYYTCMRHPDAAGIIYGASHNPSADTGQKIVGPDLQPIADGVGVNGGLQEIRRLYEADDGGTNAGTGRIRIVDYFDDYVAYSMKLAGVRPGDLDGCRILQEFLCGAAGPEFTAAFSQAGATLKSRNVIPDGHFPLGAPNPVKPEVIAPGLEVLRKGDFHFGMFFDGDGDRLDFLTPDGTQLGPGFNFAAILGELRQVFPDCDAPRVYADIKANPLAVIRMAQSGLGVHVIRNGHSQIKEALRKNWPRQMLGAVEESAHYYINAPLDGKTYPTENTLFYGLLSARHWHQNPQVYADLLEFQSATFREREWSYYFPGDKPRASALDRIERAFRSEGGSSMDRTEDGMDMEATLIRVGLPFVIDATTEIPDRWVQIAQRISQSENGLARWEVTASTAELRDDAVATIDGLVKEYGAGEKYVG
jgi:phosphomannomutase